LSTGLAELTPKILSLFNPTDFIARLQVAPVCNTITKNFYSIICYWNNQ